MKKWVVRASVAAACLTLLVVIVCGAAVYSDSTKVPCPHCGATRSAIWLSRDQKNLLELRAELKMLHRVQAYYNRHPDGVRADGENWTAEDEAISNYLKTHGFAVGPRLRFVSKAVPELEARLGKGALLCPNCKQMDLEVRAEDGIIWP